MVFHVVPSPSRGPQLFRIATSPDVDIRPLVGKGYGQVVHHYFVRRSTSMTSRTVDESMARNREKPRHQGTLRIVVGTDCMHRQQDVLYEIFDLVDGLESSIPAHDSS